LRLSDLRGPDWQGDGQDSTTKAPAVEDGLVPLDGDALVVSSGQAGDRSAVQPSEEGVSHGSLV
jgi:hypothetical protein